MAEKNDPKQRQRISGISAAAMEGAKEGEAERATNPDDANAKLARPAPGLSDPRSPNTTGSAPIGGISSTTPQTGITGGVSEVPEDVDQEWRRAGGGGGGGGGGEANQNESR